MTGPLTTTPDRRTSLPAPDRHEDGLLALLDEWAAIGACPKELLIDGRFRPARSGRTLPVEDPSTGTPLCHVADADAADAADALDAAFDAAGPWSSQPARERARVLRRAAEALDRDATSMAMLITLETGKPLTESRDEVAFACQYLEWSAEEASRIAGTYCDDPDGTARITVMRRPVGTCLIIAPWNFPLAIPARGASAALAAGCTVVLRPSRLTPLSSLAFGRILQDAGLPAGALNVVVSSTDPVTDGLLDDPRLRKLTFTGSAEVGRHLVARSAGRVVRTALELGGQAPFIVFEDADLDAAIDGAVSAKLRNGGAACTAANRFLVQEPIAQEFAYRLADRFAAIRIGRGSADGVELGPLITEGQRARLTGLVDDALSCGAQPLLAGGAMPGSGYFFAPVVLANVPATARMAREEIFGPVAQVATFRTEAEALTEANATEQGLAAYLYTRDANRAMRMAERIEAGMIALNRGRVSSVAAPFGGLKGSGYGRCGGFDGLDDYLETTYLTMERA